MEFIYRSENTTLFDELLLEYNNQFNSSPRYTNLFLEAERLYPQYYDELSFALVNKKKIKCIAYLPLEKINNNYCISSGGGYIPAPLISDDSFEKNIYFEIDKLAERHSLAHVKFYIDPIIAENYEKFNSLTRHQFIDATTASSLVPLNVQPQQLLASMRRSVRYEINKILKNNEFSVLVMDCKNSNYEIHEIYRELHHKCSGRVTRPKRTFDAQFDQIINDEAILIGLKYKEAWVSMSYFFHWKESVLYASSADDPDFIGFPIYHAILWHAICYYFERGAKWLDLCEPCTYGLQYDSYPDTKQINISKFKMGFGGKLVPLFKGVKYYNIESFINDINRFKENFMNQWEYNKNNNLA